MLKVQRAFFEFEALVSWFWPAPGHALARGVQQTGELADTNWCGWG